MKIIQLSEIPYRLGIAALLMLQGERQQGTLVIQPDSRLVAFSLAVEEGREQKEAPADFWAFYHQHQELLPMLQAALAICERCETARPLRLFGLTGICLPCAPVEVARCPRCKMNILADRLLTVELRSKVKGTTLECCLSCHEGPVRPLTPMPKLQQPQRRGRPPGSKNGGGRPRRTAAKDDD